MNLFEKNQNNLKLDSDDFIDLIDNLK